MLKFIKKSVKIYYNFKALKLLNVSQKILKDFYLKPCGVLLGATTKVRQVIFDFDMVSEIITFEEKGRFGKEKHQNLGVEVKVIA